MPTRVLTERDVYRLLPMEQCMDVMEETLRTAAQGEIVNPLRTLMRLPEDAGILGLMPAWLGRPRSTGIKVVTVTPGNHGSEFDAHQGAVLLFEPGHGRLIAVIDASSVTAIRTGAVSGVATRHLARLDAKTLAVLGSGVQASANLEAVLVARQIERVFVWSRNQSNTDSFVQHESRRHEVPMTVCESAEEAVADADIVCTTTSSPEPVLRGEWLKPGAHINAVGACFPSSRELDSQAISRSRVFVDRMESALNEAGDLLIPMNERTIGADHIQGELGEVLLGRKPGRESAGEITLFKSLGIAVEDLGAAAYLHRRAVEENVGIEVELGGLRRGPS